MSLQLGRTREGSLVLHRDRISESTAPRGQGLSEEGLRRSLAPYLYGVSDRIVVLHTATGGGQLPTMEVWRSPICVSRSPKGKITTTGSRRRGTNLPNICCDLKYTWALHHGRQQPRTRYERALLGRELQKDDSVSHTPKVDGKHLGPGRSNRPSHRSALRQTTPPTWGYR